MSVCALCWGLSVIFFPSRVSASLQIRQKNILSLGEELRSISLGAQGSSPPQMKGSAVQTMLCTWCQLYFPEVGANFCQAPCPHCLLFTLHQLRSWRCWTKRLHELLLLLCLHLHSQTLIFSLLCLPFAPQLCRHSDVLSHSNALLLRAVPVPQLQPEPYWVPSLWRPFLLLTRFGAHHTPTSCAFAVFGKYLQYFWLAGGFCGHAVLCQCIQSISLGCRPFSTNIFEPRMVISAVAGKFPSHLWFFQCFHGWAVSVCTCQGGLCLAWRSRVCMAQLIFRILPSRARAAQLCINSPFV